jgi:hypothetical protein
MTQLCHRCCGCGCVDVASFKAKAEESFALMSKSRGNKKLSLEISVAFEAFFEQYFPSAPAPPPPADSDMDVESNPSDTEAASEKLRAKRGRPKQTGEENEPKPKKSSASKQNNTTSAAVAATSASHPISKANKVSLPLESEKC